LPPPQQPSHPVFWSSLHTQLARAALETLKNLAKKALAKLEKIANSVKKPSGKMSKIITKVTRFLKGAASLFKDLANPLIKGKFNEESMFMQEHATKEEQQEFRRSVARETAEERRLGDDAYVAQGEYKVLTPEQQQQVNQPHLTPGYHESIRETELMQEGEEEATLGETHMKKGSPDYKEGNNCMTIKVKDLKRTKFDISNKNLITVPNTSFKFCDNKKMNMSGVIRWFKRVGKNIAVKFFKMIAPNTKVYGDQFILEDDTFYGPSCKDIPVSFGIQMTLSIHIGGAVGVGAWSVAETGFQVGCMDGGKWKRYFVVTLTLSPLSSLSE